MRIWCAGTCAHPNPTLNPTSYSPITPDPDSNPLPGPNPSPDPDPNTNPNPDSLIGTLILAQVGHGPPPAEGGLHRKPCRGLGHRAQADDQGLWLGVPRRVRGLCAHLKPSPSPNPALDLLNPFPIILTQYLALTQPNPGPRAHLCYREGAVPLRHPQPLRDRPQPG